MASVENVEQQKQEEEEEEDADLFATDEPEPSSIANDGTEDHVIRRGVVEASELATTTQLKDVFPPSEDSGVSFLHRIKQ